MPPRDRRALASRTLAPTTVFTAALAATACSTPPPKFPIRESSMLLAQLTQRTARVRSVRATGSADSFNSRGRIRGNVTIFVEQPDKFRVDSSAMGFVMSLVSNGTRFSLLQGSRYMYGPAKACVGQQLAGIPMEGAEVASVLSGGAPLLSDRLSPPRWEGGSYVVDVAGANGQRERLEFDLPSDQRELPPERQTPRLRAVQLSDAQGLRARVTYHNYRTVQGVAFPDRVRIVMPRDDVDTQINFDEIVPNFTIPPNPDAPDEPPPDPYRLDPPQGAQEVPVDC